MKMQFSMIAGRSLSALLAVFLSGIASAEEIDVTVRETIVRQLPNRQVIINRIADPGLSVRRPVLPKETEMTAQEIEAFYNSPPVQAWLNEAPDTTRLSLSATVIDHGATLLRWWHEGVEYEAWSNVDFNHLTGFTECSTGNRHFVTLLMASNISSANIVIDDSVHEILEDLPVETPSFHIVKGDAANTAAYEAVLALHELYETEGAQLKQAYELREQERAEREAALSTNPPVPKDIVINYWKVQSKKKQTTEAEGDGQ